MKRMVLALALLMTGTTSAQTVPVPAKEPNAKVRLWLLDCGRLEENQARTREWERVPTPTPCFLVAHGDRYLLWDTGLSARAIGANHPVAKLERTIADQLAEIGVTPERIEFVGISHYHGDHTGQATKFPAATLLIGAGDLAALGRTPSPGGAAPDHLRPWIDRTAKVEALTEDRDVFGDGKVRMLMTPGHTPGHMALLVTLGSGPVVLAGDLWFSHADALRGTMPDFNTSRAETFASRERVGRMAEKLDAAIILHHEPADLAKLPKFPAALE